MKTSFQILKNALVESQMPWWQQGVELDMDQIYTLVNTVYPFLCDPTLIRPQDGITTEWEHHTRLALIELKRNGIVSQVNPINKDERWIKA